MITTQAHTQFQWVQAALQEILQRPETRPYIKAINPGPGKVTNKFAIRLYDHHANSYHELVRIISELAEQIPLAGLPKVSCIEIALDFYSKNANPAEVVSMTHKLQAGIGAYRSDVRQFDPALPGRHGKQGRNLFFLSEKLDPEVVVRKYVFDPLFNLRIGSKHDAVSWQVYYKCIDKKQPLPIKECRARAEFTMTGIELSQYVHVSAHRGQPVYLADLQSFEFGKLAHLLHFRRFLSVDEITEGKSEHFRYVIAKTAEHARSSIACYPFGRLAYRRDARSGNPRNGGQPDQLQHSRHTVADGELNRLVQRKLKRLSQKFTQKKVTKFPA